MVVLARSRFVAGRAVDRGQRAPGVLSGLFVRLQFDQWRSLGLPPFGLGGEVWRYARWMRLDDDERARLTAREVGRLRERLREGGPVVLGLVRAVCGRGRLWQNHQVLAFALEEQDDDTLRVRVYDPNHPLVDSRELTVRPTTGGMRTQETGTGRTTDLPGWFVARGA